MGYTANRNPKEKMAKMAKPPPVFSPGDGFPER
jgi:hypothetical protein